MENRHHRTVQGAPFVGDWGLGIRDWGSGTRDQGLGIGEWGIGDCCLGY